ncbi:MAG: 4'-phosphopantetheinyl transferase family protein [Anaerovoracaceae bacterium]
MKLYIYSDYVPKGETGLNTDKLVMKALEAFRMEERSSWEPMPEIIRSESGKPVFDRGGIHFSVSHTENLWVCLMAHEPVGVDIQKNKKSAKWLKVSRRFFTQEETAFVEKDGEDAFWRIWVMKEAYIKYLGTTLAAGIGSYSMVSSGELRKEINGTTLQSIEIGQGIYGACAYAGREEICIRKLT